MTGAPNETALSPAGHSLPTQPRLASLAVMRRTLALTATLTLAFGALAACSSGDDAAETASATSSTSATEATTDASASTDATTDATTAAAEGVTGGLGADDDDILASCTGIALVVDTGDLGDDQDDTTDDDIWEDKAEAVEGAWCVEASEPMTARALLDAAGVSTDGSAAFGDDAICRVSGMPSADFPLVNTTDGTTEFETCGDSFLTFAYWAMWVKPAGGAWGYAMEGVATQMVAPGEALQLLYTLNDAPAAP